MNTLFIYIRRLILKKYNCHFLLLGGGGFSENSKDLRIEQFGLSLLNKKRPKICFIPTASSDSETYISKFYKSFSQLSCDPHHLTLTNPNVQDIQTFLQSMDGFYIGGGNTRNLLAIWKAWKIDDQFLNTLIQKPIVIWGVSAGSTIWFEKGLTDSNPFNLELIQGLNVIPGVFTPHFDSEPDRRQKWSELKFEKGENAFAIEDDVFLHFHQNQLKGVYSSRKNGQAFNQTEKLSICSLPNNENDSIFKEKEGKYVLGPYVRTGATDGVLRLGFGSLRQLISDPEEKKVSLAAMAFMTEPHSLLDLHTYLQKQFPDAMDLNAQVIHRLVNGNYFIPENGFDKNDRFSRHFLYYFLSGANAFEVQKKLANSHVAILGCGGIGNIVAVTLATLGIGKLTIVDGDFIEESNLGRQIMFTQHDIGRMKVDVLKESLLARNPNVVVETVTKFVDGFIQSPDCLKKIPLPISLMVLSADTPGLDQMMNQFCIQHNQPFINIGYVVDIAVFGPLVIPGKTGCFACQSLLTNNQGLTEEERSNMKLINSRFSSPSIGPVNLLSSSLGLLEIVRFLGDLKNVPDLKTAKARIGLWTDSFNLELQKINRNQNCKVCGSQKEKIG